MVAPEEKAKDGDLPVSPAVIGDVLQPGNDVLIDDGLVRLRVERVDSGRALCTVLVGGPVGSHKGVNLPGVPLPIPVADARRTSRTSTSRSSSAPTSSPSRSSARPPTCATCAHGSRRRARTAQVIAKIEKAEAVQALDEILAESYAVMVARGDLGVEIGPTSVPLLQKRIISKALERGKPVITATQMLESMIVHAEPTRAEASDVANAILDGTSAVMLSGETAMGQYPVEAVAFMDRIAREVEPQPRLPARDPRGEREPVDRRTRCRTSPATSPRRSRRRRSSSPPSAAVRPRPSRACARAGRSSGLTHLQHSLQ